MPSFIAPNGTNPATGGKAITPSDTANLEPVTRAILVAVDGAVAVEYIDGTQHVIPLLSAGVMHPIHVRKVLSTGTTATGVNVFY